VLLRGEGSARELAYRTLLDMALVKEVQHIVAERGEVAGLAKALAAAVPPRAGADGGPGPAGGLGHGALVGDGGGAEADAAALRAEKAAALGAAARGCVLEVLVLLARLCARCTACQLDAVREGAGPPLVALLSASPAECEALTAAAAGGSGAAAGGGTRTPRAGPPSGDLRAHAGRLLAILAQHASTHQLLLEAGALPFALKVLRECEHWRNHEASRAAAAAASAAAAAAVSALAMDLAAFQAALQGLQGAAGAAPPAAAAAAAAAAVSGGARGGAARGRGPGAGGAAAGQRQQQQEQQPDSSASLVETCASICCMFAHNPDNHFALVNQGAVVLLVPLLARGEGPVTTRAAGLPARRSALPVPSRPFC
jgi:hypothetical protein